MKRAEIAGIPERASRLSDFSIAVTLRSAVAPRFLHGHTRVRLAVTWYAREGRERRRTRLGRVFVVRTDHVDSLDLRVVEPATRVTLCFEFCAFLSCLLHRPARV
jgi:hypothetical protein